LWVSSSTTRHPAACRWRAMWSALVILPPGGQGSWSSLGYNEQHWRLDSLDWGVQLGLVRPHGTAGGPCPCLGLLPCQQALVVLMPSPLARGSCRVVLHGGTCLRASAGALWALSHVHPLHMRVHMLFCCLACLHNGAVCCV
jgi:hypothetical protein